MNWARIAGFIFLAYIVFTTMKGNLRKWLQIIGLKPDGEQRAGAIMAAIPLPQPIADLPPIGPQLRGRSQ